MVDKIRIDSVAANISRVCVQPMNAAGHENEYDIFDTIDPIYSIDVPKGQSLEWIEITGEIVEERDDLIFQHKQNQLEKVAEETKILRVPLRFANKSWSSIVTIKQPCSKL